MAAEPLLETVGNLDDGRDSGSRYAEAASTGEI